MSGRRRALAALGTAVVVVGLPAATAVAAGKEDNPGGCGASAVVAAAWGVQLTVTRSDNLVLAHPGGAGVPVAQSCVDYGLRETMAFASSPYPGEFLRTLPGHTGRPEADYPAYAGSRYPSDPESAVDKPGMKLLARSSETASTGRAQSAVDPENETGSTLTTAESSVDPAAGTSIATATADLQPFTVKDVLTVGQVESVAKASYTKEGTIERSSDLRIGRTTVAGQEVVITARGVRAAGQTAALPDAGAAQEQLAQAGVTVRYLEAEKTPGGILSAGVEISVANEDPATGAATTLRYVLGRSFATAGPVDATPAQGGGGSGPVDSPAPAVSESGESPVASGDAPAEAAVPVADAPADAPAPEAAPPAPSVADPPEATQSVALVGNPVDLGLGGAYLVIVLGALAMFVSGTLVRLLGVKTRWTS